MGTYEAVIDDRLERTRRHVKSVDVMAGCLALGVGVLAYLGLAAVLDHWVFTGGLGFQGRLVLWAVLVVGTTSYFAGRILPALVRRVNPVYAAQAIEQSRPTLKNSVINFLLLRRERQQVATVVYEAVEQRAANDLRRVTVDTTVDRTHVLRLSYMLAGVVTILVLYLFISPKNPLISFHRMVWPWADVMAPTRVVFENIEPGDASMFLGEFASVAVDVSGLKQGEGVTLYYTTADNQIVGAAVPLTVASEGYRWRCTLPPGALGLQQDLDYYLAAGDARTRTFHILVQVNPVIVVDRVDYHYPSYTGIADESIEREGNLRAIEGTQVTLHAKANQEIARAEIDLDCTGKPGLVMKSQATEAIGQFVLSMKSDAPDQPEYTSYQLRFTDTHKRPNHQPIRHRIEVLRDLPPEVQIVEPAEEEVAVAENGQLDIRVRAADPDFGMRRVVLRLQHKGTDLTVPPLLHKAFPAEPHKGEFLGSYRFEPAKLGLKAGDHVVCWAEADDNRATDDNQPKPNHTESQPKHRIAIVAGQPHRAAPPKPDPGQNGPRQPGNQDQRPDQPEGKAQDQQGEAGSGASAKKDAKQGSGRKSDGPGDSNENRGKEPAGQEPGEQQSKDQPGQGGQGGGAKSGKSDPSQPKKSDSAADDQQAGDKSSESNEPVDPKTDPGTAFERMAKFFDDQKKKQQPEQNQSEKQANKPGDNSQQLASNEDQQQKSSNADSQQAGKQPQGDQQGGGKDKAGQQSPGEQKDSDQAGGQKQGGAQPKPGQQAAEQGKSSQQQQAGKQAQGDQQAGGKDKAGQQSAGEQKNSDQAGGQKQGEAQPKSGQQAAEQGKSSQQQQAGGKKQQGASQQSSGTEAKSDQQAGAKGDQGKTGQQSAGAQTKPDQQAGKQGGPSEKSDQPSSGGKPKADQKSDGSQSQLAKADQQASGKSGEKGQQDKSDSKPGERLPGNEDKRGQASPDKEASSQAKPTERSDSAQSDKTAQKSDAKAADKEQTGSTPSPENGAGGNKAAAKPENRATDKPSGGGDPLAGPKKPDSRQDMDGDRSGGGGKSAGQQAKQSGSDQAGSQSPGDQGASQGNQKGEGQTGERAGDQVQSKERTGESTAQTPGANTRPGEKSSEGKAGQERPTSDDSQSKTASSPSDGPSNKAGQSDQAGDGKVGGNPVTGGQPNQPNEIASLPPGEEPGGDEANLEYAAKQTDLVLQALREQLQKGQPDPELLKRLGNWSRRDLEDFYHRWEQMKRAAGDGDPKATDARKDFRNALRSLGLRPKATVLQGGKSDRDQLHSMNESRRVAPPPNWAPLLKAYTEGVAGQK